ncbi:MAG: hydroxyacid dehydrogenase [Candidatus Omnitrophica bacterium]|nr:hydroxyacid dehydrogenase [Candidatus Omnitrophota bacterium]
MDVYFFEVFEEEERALKQVLSRSVRARFTPHTVQRTGLKEPPAGLISIRTQSIIPPYWVPRLKGILTRSTGYDHIQDFLKGVHKKIPCGFLPKYCARSVAEQVFLSILALKRRLKRQMSQFATFNRSGLTGGECAGARLLVVGVGAIGGEVVRLGRAMGMRIRGVDIVRRLRGLTYVSLKEGVRSSDVIVCTLPLTEKTRGLLCFALLEKAPRGAIFVNISRGEISPVKDLKRLLDEGILSGLAMDVYEDEKRLAEHLRFQKPPRTEAGKTILSLKKRDNVLFTPHNAFNTVEALKRKARLSAESVVQFLRRGRFPHPIPEDRPETRDPRPETD